MSVDWSAIISGLRQARNVGVPIKLIETDEFSLTEVTRATSWLHSNHPYGGEREFSLVASPPAMEELKGDHDFLPVGTDTAEGHLSGLTLRIDHTVPDDTILVGKMDILTANGDKLRNHSAAIIDRVTEEEEVDS